MMCIDGCTGRLLVGYQVAARLGRVSVTLLPVAPRQYRIDAMVDVVSSYWLSQRPLDVEVVVGSRRWVWKGVSPEAHAEDRWVIDVRGAPDVIHDTVRGTHGQLVDGTA